MQRCMKAVEDFAPQFVECVRNTDSSTIVEHGLFARTPEQHSSYADKGWGVGRVTLVGDAAHAMRPTGTPPVATCYIRFVLALLWLPSQHLTVQTAIITLPG